MKEFAAFIPKMAGEDETQVLLQVREGMRNLPN